MAADYNKRQSDWAKKEQAIEDEERKGEIKVGEASGKATGDIRKSDEVKIRIDDVETLRFKPSFDLKRGDPIKITVKADLAMRGQEKQRWGRERSVQAGEALGKATGDIRKSDEVKVRIDDVETLRFKSSADLKKGDSVRVIIEKV